MKIHQLSIFIENRPGHLTAPCAVLADAGINILTLTLADTERFGILRLIVRPWEQAKEILEKCGCVVKVTEVVAIEVEDRPGGLRALLDIVEEAGVNIEYMYAFTVRSGTKAVMIFRFADMDKGIAALVAAGVNVLSSVVLYDRAETAG
ncbi:MAG: ACT domain-containing protein [Verrucomicrobiota bacterium]